MKHENLSTLLRERVEILSLMRRPDGSGWSWETAKTAWAGVEQDRKRTIYSENAVSARGANVVLRPGGCTMRNLIRWRGVYLLPARIIPSENRDRIEIRTAEVLLRDFRAEPQKRTDRDQLNRPVAVGVPSFTFQGVLAEQYHGNQEAEIHRTDVVRRVLVTDPAIRLRPGDLIRCGEEAPYTVRTVGDLDPDRTEYIIERESDV